MKKLLRAGLVILFVFTAFLSLTACGSKGSEKKEFISDYASFYKTDDNVQEISVVLNKFKATGDSADQMNLLKDAKATIKVGVDSKNKVVGLAGTVDAMGKSYKLNLLLAESGMYIASADLKALYNDNKSLLTSGITTNEKVYDAMIEGLTAPYLLMDAATLDQSMSSSGETWESTIDEIFTATSKPLSEADLTKTLKDAPDSAFTKNGNQSVFKFNLGSDYFQDFLKGMASSNAKLTKSQTDQLLKSVSDADLKKMTGEISLDKKLHALQMILGGKTGSTKSSLDFEMKITSKSSKLKEEFTVPSADQTQTLVDVQNAAVAILTSGQNT